MPKAVVVLDLDAVRRADSMDPKQFVESLRRSLLTRDSAFYASGMLAGRVIWIGAQSKTANIHVTKGLQAEVKGEVVVTKNARGEIVAVTRQDEEGRILEVIAEPGECECDRSECEAPEICESAGHCMRR